MFAAERDLCYACLTLYIIWTKCCIRLFHINITSSFISNTALHWNCSLSHGIKKKKHPVTIQSPQTSSTDSPWWCRYRCQHRRWCAACCWTSHRWQLDSSKTEIKGSIVTMLILRFLQPKKGKCNHSSVTVVMRASSPSFLGQISLARSITVPVGPQQFSWTQTEQEHWFLHQMMSPGCCLIASAAVALGLFVLQSEKTDQCVHVLTPKWIRRKVSFSASCLVSL